MSGLTGQNQKEPEMVDYTPRTGAVCPACGVESARTTTTYGWIKGDLAFYRKRRHQCRGCGIKFNSLQESQ